jgi:hypothetical protein
VTINGVVQTAGDINILAIGWNEATSNITSVSDRPGNVYQVAAPTARGADLSQAMYYAKNIAAASAGANTVTVTFNSAVRFADIRILEYAGLDTNVPLDVTRSAPERRYWPTPATPRRTTRLSSSSWEG